MKSTVAWLIRFVACTLAVMVGSYDGCDVRADQAHQAITPELVLAVQSAIRWRDAAWGEDMAREFATAVNRTRDPLQTMAGAINESDLRRLALRLTLKGDGSVAADVGIRGVRCVLKGADARAAWRSVSVLTQEQIEQQPPRGRCTNGPARGFTIRQLQNVRTNITVAEVVFNRHGRNLGQYNGATQGWRQRAYAGRILAIEAALQGRQVRVKLPRMVKLTGQIVQAVQDLRSKPPAPITNSR